MSKHEENDVETEEILAVIDALKEARYEYESAVQTAGELGLIE